MPNKNIPAPLFPSAFVDVSSRYFNSDVIYYTDENLITYATYKKKPPPLSKTDKFYLINEASQYRPDLVSNIAYGLSSYWWRIMEANNMKDISDFKAGVTIRIPDSLF